MTGFPNGNIQDRRCLADIQAFRRRYRHRARGLKEFATSLAGAPTPTAHCAVARSPKPIPRPTPTL